MLLNIIFPMVDKKSLMSAENERIAVAGGVRPGPPTPDIHLDSPAEEMSIRVDI